MPQIKKNAGDQEREGISAPIDQIISEIPEIKYSAAFTPIMICGVNRKINTGNFENLDVYCGITVPIGCSTDDLVEFKRAAEEAAKIGFAIVSTQTNERYNTIKSAQGGGRPQ